MQTDDTRRPCPYCGEMIVVGAKKCRYCDEWLEKPPAGYMAAKECGNKTHPPKGQLVVASSKPESNNVVTVNNESSSNGVGTAGFVLALISLILSWVPVIGWFVWFLGLILSFFGMFSKPRGLAVAGFLISIIDVIILVTEVGIIGGIISSILG